MMEGRSYKNQPAPRSYSLPEDQEIADWIVITYREGAEPNVYGLFAREKALNLRQQLLKSSIAKRRSGYRVVAKRIVNSSE